MRSSNVFDPICHPNGLFCNDDLPPTESGGRIDYIFIETPQVTHAFNLDV